ncbi:hypothetical protein [Actinoplanes sp. HUAS TT8]|uniref:hypothetical protein n=1 Tax=Actinoplanes sp. HUAS TT8 TaxID=3447453 RepID=UPI003F51FCFB
MTDKANIWHISLGLLGTVGVCALTLLAGAQEAQAAPAADDPSITTAPLQDGTRTDLTPISPSRITLSGAMSGFVPDGDQVSTGVPDVVVRKPPPGPKGPWWNPNKPPMELDTEITVPGGIGIGSLARAR